MTFLNPLALFGLLAAAIPILLHLLNLRKLRTIEFSTLSFLKELQKSSIRRLKLRQILLLILRTLLVLLIVIAFSRPTLRGSLIGNIGVHAKTTAVFIVDDSYSMTVSDDRGELLKQAKQSAHAALQLFRDGDEVFLLPLSALTSAHSTNETAVRDFALLRSQIDGIKASALRGSLEDALRISARLLATSGNFNKEVYIFSDFQQGVLRNDAQASSGNEHLFAPDVRFFFVRLGRRDVQNFGFESVSIPTSIFEREKPFTVQARIGNYTSRDVQDHVVSVFLNGARVAERSVDLKKNSVLPIEFSVVANATGFIQGFVETEDDDLQYDNRRYFTLDIPERLRALIVGDANDLRFPRLALSTRASSSESALVVDEVTPDRLSTVEIRRADVILLCTSAGFTAPQLSELAAFVRNGGGLVLFPASHVDPAAFNSSIGSALSLPALAAVDRPQASAGSESYIEFGKVELKHPLFEGMFESQNSQSGNSRSPGTANARVPVESPRVRTSARFMPNSRSTSIITLTNDAPFLVEQQMGSGTIFLFAVPPTTEWSDLPLKGIFVPLLHRSVLYLARQRSRAEESLPGAEVTIRSRSAGSGTWTIRNPGAIDITASPASQGFQQILRFNSTELPGIYTVSSKDGVIEQFAVNIDPRESQTQKATDAEINGLLGHLGIAKTAVNESNEAADVQRIVQASRYGVELWKYFLILALVVALVELFVARSFKSEMVPVPHD